MRTIMRSAILSLVFAGATAADAAAPRGLRSLLQARPNGPLSAKPLSLELGSSRLSIAPSPEALPRLEADKWRALEARLQGAAALSDATPLPAARPLPAATWAQAVLGVEQALERLSVSEIEHASDERLGALVDDISTRLQRTALGQTPAIREPDGLLVGVGDPRGRRFKVFAADGLTLERRRVPASLSEVYAELPEGGVRKTAIDPLEESLRAAGVELWTVRHGEAETNRAALLAGGGTNAPLTDTPNAKGVSGTVQAAAAARELYSAFGGDSWAREVLGGRLDPVVILASPLRRARQTAAAFKALLDERAAALGGGRRLFEFRVSRSLREMAYGRLEGLPLEAAKRMSFWAPWATAPSGSGRDFLDRFPGGESRFDVMLRQRTLLERVLAHFPGRRIVTFAHYETVIAQQAVLGLLNEQASDLSLQAAPIENAKPAKLLGR